MNLEEANETMDDFYGGVQMLQRLAGWAYVVANQREALEHVLLLEGAYEKLVKAHEEGKADAGAADVSRESLARVKRLCELIRSGLDTEEAKQAAPEILGLAEQSFRGLTGQGHEVSEGSRSAPGAR